MKPEPSNSNAASQQGATRKKPGGPLSGGLGVVLCLVLFVIAGVKVYRTLTTAPSPTEPRPVEYVFMCSETGKTFKYELHKDGTSPVVSPYTNKKTGYRAEACYWTKDGKRKQTPTYVILNEYLGKAGDTFCPDCGRVVIGHNPMPGPEVPLASESSPAGAGSASSPSGSTQPVGTSAAPSS